MSFSGSAYQKLIFIVLAFVIMEFFMMEEDVQSNRQEGSMEKS
jgi:preprotein translocase subunit YajC